MARRKRPPLLVRLPLLIGVTFLLGAGVSAWPQVTFVQKAERAEGVFAGGVGRIAGKPATAYAHPRFRFTTRDGAVVSFTSRTGSTGYVAGDTASVYYDPVQPTDARLGSVREMWLGPLILAVIGVAMAAAGVSIAAAWRRRAS